MMKNLLTILSLLAATIAYSQNMPTYPCGHLKIGSNMPIHIAYQSREDSIKFSKIFKDFKPVDMCGQCMDPGFYRGPDFISLTTIGVPDKPKEPRIKDEPKTDTVPVLLQYIDTAKYTFSGGGSTLDSNIYPNNYRIMNTSWFNSVIQWTRGYEVIKREPAPPGIKGLGIIEHVMFLTPEKREFPKSYIVKPY